MSTGWFVVEPPTAGVLNPLMRRAKMNASGQMPYVGPFAGSLKKPLAGMVGQVGPAGGIIGKLKKCTAVMNGGQTFTGGMGASLKRMTFTGIVTNNGNMSAKMKRLTSSSSGLQKFTGSLGAALKRAKATVQAAQIQSGVMAAISKRVTATMAGTAPLILTNTLSGNSFDTSFWGQNWNQGVNLSGGVVGCNPVGGYYGSGFHPAGITCKTQFSANGAFVEAKVSSGVSDDRGAILYVGVDSPTAITKTIYLRILAQQSTNLFIVNGGTVLAQVNASDLTANDIWRFAWKKVGNDYVYKGYRNGVSYISWTDTNGATFGVPGRYVAIGSSVIQKDFNNYYSQNNWIGTVTCGDNT